MKSLIVAGITGFTVGSVLAGLMLYAGMNQELALDIGMIGFVAGVVLVIWNALRPRQCVKKYVGNTAVRPMPEPQRAAWGPFHRGERQQPPAYHPNPAQPAQVEDSVIPKWMNDLANAPPNPDTARRIAELRGARERGEQERGDRFAAGVEAKLMRKQKQ